MAPSVGVKPERWKQSSATRVNPDCHPIDLSILSDPMYADKARGRTLRISKRLIVIASVCSVYEWAIGDVLANGRSRSSR